MFILLTRTRCRNQYGCTQIAKWMYILVEGHTKNYQGYWCCWGSIYQVKDQTHVRHVQGMCFKICFITPFPLISMYNILILVPLKYYADRNPNIWKNIWFIHAYNLCISTCLFCHHQIYLHTLQKHKDERKYCIMADLNHNYELLYLNG